MNKLLFFLLLIFIIPISLTSILFKYDKALIKTGFINKQYKDKKIRILLSDNSIKELNLEDYLVGVVSSEVPVSFEDEALKAQAVASRTYALKQMENNKNNDYDVTDNVLSQVYSDEDKLKERWGNDFEKNYNKIKDAITKTKGEYISYNGDVIYAFFFSTSNGKTEDNINVFGEDLPYLKPVDSSFDEESPSYSDSKTISKSDFYNLLGIDYSDNLDIEEVVKTDSDRVYSLKINDNLFIGREFQKLLSLRSNDFDIEERDTDIIINTKGFGHGVGLSQYGANALAKQHKNYKEILKYYYKDTEIKKF